jgi:hypothetical protein
MALTFQRLRLGWAPRLGILGQNGDQRVVYSLPAQIQYIYIYAFNGRKICGGEIATRKRKVSEENTFEMKVGKLESSTIILR